jgi:hypothetical protein
MSLIDTRSSGSESEVMTAMGDNTKTDNTKTDNIKTDKFKTDKLNTDKIKTEDCTNDRIAGGKAIWAVANNDQDRFTVTELAALRQDLLQVGMVDSCEAAELLRIFLTGRGYGVSPSAARDAAGRVEMAGCALPVLQHELENLAMVM